MNDDDDDLNGLNQLVGIGDDVRNARGQFVVGHAPLPGAGRPRGSTLDLMTVCRRGARERGVDLEAYVWEVVQTLVLEATCGNIEAAKIVLDRLCGVLQKNGVEINVGDNRRVLIGPPVPEGQDLGVYMRELAEAAEGLLASDFDEADDLIGE